MSTVNLAIAEGPGLNLDDLRNSRGAIWLNVASSHDVLPEYVNLDNGVFFRLDSLRPLVDRVLSPPHRETLRLYSEARRRSKVVMHDCRRPLPFAEGTVDHILCSHFLEHVYPDEATVILRDFLKALVPGGTLHVIVPSVRKVVDDYLAKNPATAADGLMHDTFLSSPSRPSLRFRVLEMLGFEGLKHRWMYDQASISERVASSGFELTRLEDVPSSGYRQEDGAVSAHVAARKPLK